MVETDKNDGANERPAAKAAKAVVRPKQDYSELPQKPITLKKGIGGLAAPVKTNVESAEKPLAASTAKPKKRVPAKRKRAAKDHWILRGVSISARDVATKAARAEGVKLGEWLDQLILRTTTAPAQSGETQQQVLEALQDIQNRLERIEYQRGFLSRLWEQLKSRSGW
jgi:hypothetical protein